MKLKKHLVSLAVTSMVIAPLSVHATVPTGKPMYRMYNPNSGEHFYTANKDERNNLFNVGWRYEGIGWVAPEKSNKPVYRLYNKNAGDHHYTMSKEEKDHLVSVGWIDEGTGWYSEESDKYPLYRQYNPNAKAGSHNYTLSKEENDHLASLGWREEGVAWYATTNSTPSTITGWKQEGTENWKKRYYLDSDLYPKDQWYNIDGKTYHFDKDGYLDVGTHTYNEQGVADENGTAYLLDYNTGELQRNRSEVNFRTDSEGRITWYTAMYTYPSNHIEYMTPEGTMNSGAAWLTTLEESFKKLAQAPLQNAKNGMQYIEFEDTLSGIPTTLNFHDDFNNVVNTTYVYGIVLENAPEYGYWNSYTYRKYSNDGKKLSYRYAIVFYEDEARQEEAKNFVKTLGFEEFAKKEVK